MAVKNIIFASPYMLPNVQCVCSGDVLFSWNEQSWRRILSETQQNLLVWARKHCIRYCIEDAHFVNLNNLTIPATE